LFVTIFFSQTVDAHKITSVAGAGTPVNSALAIGTDGFPVVVHETLTSPLELKIVHCTSNDCSTKDSPTTLDITGFNTRPSITIGNDGFPVISYFDGSIGEGNPIKVVHCTNVNCSTFDTPQIIDAGPNSVDSSITIGTDGFPVISYADAFSVAKLQFVHCTSVNCSTFDSPLILDSDTRVGTSSRVKIGTDGFPIISYAIINNPGVRILHCTSIDCSTFDVAKTLDSLSTGIFEVDMALGSDGFPVLSYNEVHVSEQRVLHCTSIDCSTSDSPLIIDSGAFSTFSSSVSIAISSDGFPIVIYSSGSANDLTLVNCITIDCSIVSFPLLFDTGIGFSTSTAIGSDGFPAISYQDSGGGISLVHCQDVNCDLFDNIPQFITTLEGSQEVPPVSTNATGFAEFTLNEAGDEMAFEIFFNLADITGLHIHRAPSGVNGEIIVGFENPDTVSSDIHPTISDTLFTVPPSSSFTGTITSDGLSGTLTAQLLSSLVNEMIAGNTYVNIHTVANSGGEIRGQIEPCLPPSSGNWVVEFDCTLVNNAVASANVIIQSGSVLVIPSGLTLDIDFTQFNLTVQSGGGVLIKAGGSIT